MGFRIPIDKTLADKMILTNIKNQSKVKNNLVFIN